MISTYVKCKHNKKLHASNAVLYLLARKESC
jgi:hypothetical protein